MRDSHLFRTLDALAACTELPEPEPAAPEQPNAHPLDATQAGGGVTRFSWSEADAAARRFLIGELTALGLAPWTDGVGNLHARLKGTSDLPAVLMGSHLDSVRRGGRLDGAFGVAAALETLRAFRREGFTPRRDVEFIAFAEEEGSNFGCTCLGSKAISGQIDLAGLRELRNAAGQNAVEVLTAFGLQPENVPEQQIDPASVGVFLEVHIEQGAALERAGMPLGVVTAISAMHLDRITLGGHQDHAASPMRGRRDPAAGFAEFAFRMESLWREGDLPEDFSCTTGSVHCLPDVGIAVPQTVTFTLDTRHVSPAVLAEGRERILALARAVATARGLSMDHVPLSASGGTRLSPEAGEAFRAAARRHGAETLSLVSGPAHDAAALGKIVPAGLLFVPSAGGFSHCPQEHTEPEDLALGAKVFQDAVRAFAQADHIPPAPAA